MLYVNTLIAFLVSINTVAQKNDPFELKGYAKGAREGSAVYLEPIIEKSNYYQIESDSSIIHNGKFSFKGKLQGPLAVRVIVKDKEIFARSGMVFIEKGNLSTEFSIDTLHNNIFSIIGSETQKQYLRSFLPIFIKYKKLNDEWATQIQKKYDEFESYKLDSAVSEMRIEYKKISKNYVSELSNYAIAHNNSTIPVYLMIEQLNGYEKKFANTLPGFSSIIKYTKPYQILKESLSKSKSLQEGEYFPYFNLINLGNNLLEPLSSHFSQNLTFIDFWFAKCGACIRQFPAYRTIKDIYADSIFFTLISITIDKENELQNAKDIIIQQKNNWIQLWDKNGKYASSLNINSYPSNFLIDRKGKIIAKDMEPLELARFLRMR